MRYLSSTMARMVSSLMGRILPTSCEVRKPSKKCMNGMRDSSVAICATRARSAASCTELEASMAQPVERQAITSEWSPKMESACVARVRAVTCMRGRGQLAGDLEHVGDHQQQALRGGEGGGEGPGLQCAVQRAGSAAFALQLFHDGQCAPDVLLALRAPLIGPLGHGGRGGDGVDGDDFGEAIGNGGRSLVPVHNHVESQFLVHSFASLHSAAIEEIGRYESLIFEAVSRCDAGHREGEIPFSGTMFIWRKEMWVG